MNKQLMLKEKKYTNGLMNGRSCNGSSNLITGDPFAIPEFNNVLEKTTRSWNPDLHHPMTSSTYLQHHLYVRVDIGTKAKFLHPSEVEIHMRTSLNSVEKLTDGRHELAK